MSNIFSCFLKVIKKKTHLILYWCLLQVCWMYTVLNASSWTIWSSCVLITLTRSCSSTLWLITWRPSRRSMWPRGCSGPSYSTKTTRAAWTWLKAVPPVFSPCSMRFAHTPSSQKKMWRINIIVIRDFCMKTMALSVKASFISFGLYSIWNCVTNVVIALWSSYIMNRFF